MYLKVVVKELDGLHSTIGELIGDAQHLVQQVKNMRVLSPIR